MPIVGAPSTTAQLILDPVTEDATNVELVIGDGTNYGLTAHTYPAPNVDAQWASSVSTEGAALASQRHENRTITVTVDVNGLGALQDLEAELAKLYREGGTLKRVDADGREIVFDVLMLDGYEPSFDLTHHIGGVTTVTFTLTCKPYGRGAEIALSDHVETTRPVLVFTETNIPGDMPALGRLVMDNDSANAQNTLLWAVETTASSAESLAGKRYNATASLFSEFEATPTGSIYDGIMTLWAPTSVVTGAAGASGSHVARNTAVSSSVDTLATYQTALIGTFRLFVRVQVPVTNTGTVALFAQYSAYAQSGFTSNAAVTIDPAWEGTWRLLDLGPIQCPVVDPPVQIAGVDVGPGYTEISIRASSTAVSDDIDLDYLFLLPAHGRSGQLTDTSGIVAPAAGTSGSVILRHDGVVRRANATLGLGYSTPRKYEGDYLLIPPSGREGHGARFIVKFSRGEIATGADASIDDLSAQLYVTPRYLVIPEA